MTLSVKNSTPGFVAVTTNASDAGSIYTADATYNTSDYEISVDAHFAAGDSSYTRSLILRAQDSNNMYLLRISNATMTIYKRVAGTWTSLGSGSGLGISDNVSSPYYIATLTFTAIGSTLTGKVNGVTKVTVTDSSITDAGKAGIGLGRTAVSTDDSGTGLYVDNVIVQTASVDSTAPTITNISSDKTNGSYTVGEVIDIDVTFSEAVTSDGNVTVALETGATDRTCTFTVTASTTGTCNYTVQASDTSSDLTVNTISGMIADLNSNAMVNFAPATNLAANKALAIDTTDPVSQSLAPSDNETNFSPLSIFLIIFNEVVDIETGNITIKKTSDDSTVETISVSGGLVTGTGTNMIAINPSTNLSNLTEYYILVDATAFDDAAGNSYAGISSTTAWNFTTADIGIPAVVSFSPLDGISDVGIDDNLIIVFDEIVDVESGNIFIYKSTDDSLVTTIAITDAQITGAGTDTITINPTVDFDYATGYYMQIDATAFDDTSGNSYAGIIDTTTWNFTTESAPVVPVVEDDTPRRSSGSSVKSRVKNLIDIGNTEKADALINEFPNQFENKKPVPVAVSNEVNPTNSTKFVFNKIIRPQETSLDVLELQKFLNANGFMINSSGPGSKGFETSYFGPLTQNALKKFQEANRSSVLDPVGLTSGTGILGPSTRAFINNYSSSTSVN